MKSETAKMVEMDRLIFLSPRRYSCPCFSGDTSPGYYYYSTGKRKLLVYFICLFIYILFFHSFLLV